MMRALWSAASGMINQQTNVDTIANNLANVSTVGFKSEKAEFKSILYQTITAPNDTSKPVGTQIGLGVRTAGISSNYEQGVYQETGLPWDFAINGEGFFRVLGRNGEEMYTRNGNFSLTAADGELWLVTGDGYPVLDRNGSMISFPGTVNANEISVDQDGRFYVPDENNQMQEMGIQFGFAQFNNPTGLYKVGGTYVKPSPSSGEPRFEGEDAQLEESEVRQKYLEASNVKVVDAMVDMIVAQRAYEMNSKAIQASDEMLGQANQLKR